MTKMRIPKRRVLWQGAVVTSLFLAATIAAGAPPASSWAISSSVGSTASIFSSSIAVSICSSSRSSSFLPVCCSICWACGWVNL